MLFVHDHVFLHHDGVYYTTGSLNQSIMNRYIKWFGTVSVFATTRGFIENHDNTFIKKNNQVDTVDFYLVPKSFSPSALIKYSRMIDHDVQSADCVVVRMSIFGLMAVFAARRHNIPYLVEMVACPWDSLWFHSFKGKLVAPWMTILTKIVCKQAPYVIYVTNKFLQRRYPTKGVTIGCSDVELSQIHESNLSTRIQRIGSSSEQKTIKLVTVANVSVKYKGQAIVIKSIRALKKMGIDCEYYLIGDGDQSRLRRIASKANVSDCVHFLGPKPHEEVFNQLKDMDIYVQPSFQEGLPRAVVEAMSMGCPVVGSNAGGIPELLDARCVFKKGSMRDFIKVLQRFDKAFCVEQSRRNFEVSKNYVDSVLRSKRDHFYGNFYENVMNSRGIKNV